MVATRSGLRSTSKAVKHSNPSPKDGVHISYKHSSELLLASIRNFPLSKQLRLINDLGDKMAHPIMDVDHSLPSLRPSIRVPDGATITVLEHPVRQAYESSVPNTNFIPLIIVTTPDGIVENPQSPAEWKRRQRTAESRQQLLDWFEGTFLSPKYPVDAYGERRRQMKKEKQLREHAARMREVRAARLKSAEAKRKATS